MVVASVLAGTTGCGDTEERSLCVVYDDYLAAAEAVRAVDPAVDTTEEMSAVLDNAVNTVHQLGQVADSRYTEPVKELEAALKDVKRVLDSQEEGADPSTWQPLVEDSVEDAQDAASRVTSLIDPSCRPGS